MTPGQPLHFVQPRNGRSASVFADEDYQLYRDTLLQISRSFLVTNHARLPIATVGKAATLIRLILLVGLLAATTGCALGDKLKAEARAEREIFYYKGHERVPLTFSSDLYVATVRPRPGPTDRKAVVQTMENAGALNVRLRGEQLYFKAPERAVADRALQALTAAGIDYTSLSAAILGQRQPVFIGDQVVVKLRDDKDLAAFRAYIKRRGAAEVGHYRFGGHDRMVLRAAKRTSVIGLANRIQEDGWSIFAQPDFIVQGEFNYTPNDMIFTEQDREFRMLRIPEAWEITKGNPAVAVAIFDSGYRLTHPDLADYFLRRSLCGPLTRPQADCSDFKFPFSHPIPDFTPFWPTNIVAPFDAVDDDDNPEMESSLDFHGTLVLGTIGAKTDNFTGVAGVGFNNKVVPVKAGVTIECFLGGGICADFSCSAITRAANHVINAAGLDIVAVNMSFVLGTNQLCFEDALSDIHIHARQGKGAVMIAGTGNDGSEVGRRVFPASFPFVIGAGETDDGESRRFSSNFGPLVDIMAPGTMTTTRRGQIGLNDVQNDYFFFSGTSASAAMVSGIVGLIASVQPARNASELERILLHSADLMLEDLQYTWVDDHVLGMKNAEVGFGRVDAFKAVRMASRLHIPRSVYPLLYVSRTNGDKSIYVLDKEPDRNFPNFSELVMTTLEIQGEPLEGEYLAVQLRTVPLRGEGVNLLYRVGNQAELIQVLDPISGFGSVLYRRSLSDGPLPGTSIAYVANRRVVRDQTTIPLLRAQFLVTYYPKDGMQRTYRLTDGFLGQLNLTQVHEEQLNPNGGYSYGFLKEGFQARLVRFSPADRRLDFVAIDDSGTPSGPTTSTTFTPEDQPELWTVYSGKDKNFLYWQADPFSYQIAEITLDGAIVTKEKHNSSFSDTPFDRMAVHHVYDQDKPYFIFWKNNGIVKVKRLISELELDIFTVNTKSFKAQGVPGNIWMSSEMLTY